MSESTPNPKNKKESQIEDSQAEKEKHFQVAVIKFRDDHPELKVPAIPTRSLEYKGWFDSVRENIRSRKEKEAAEQHAVTVKAYNTLLEEYLKTSKIKLEAMKLKQEMDLTDKRSDLTDLQIKVEQRELEAKLKKLEVEEARAEAEITSLKNPPPVSRIQQKKDELEEADLDDKIKKLKNPLQPPPIPTPTERIERELTGFKDLEEWKKSWPDNESEDMKQLRLRLFKEKKARLIDKA